MTANLTGRIVRLEAGRVPPVEIETSFTPALRLLKLLMAAHLGDLRPGEDVATGEARALGYGSAAEMQSAMVAERTAFIGWGSAHNVAMARMLARYDDNPGAGPVSNGEALAALLAALPAAFTDHPDADSGALPTADEWISL